MTKSYWFAFDVFCNHWCQSQFVFKSISNSFFSVKIRGLFCQLYSWQLHILYYRFYQSIVRQQYGKLGDLLFRRKLLNKKVWQVESSKAKTPIKPAYYKAQQANFVVFFEFLLFSSIQKGGVMSLHSPEMMSILPFHLLFQETKLCH